MNFENAFTQLTGHPPFPWQRSLYETWLSTGKIPSSCNLPTGLGKTSVIAIWLIALANGAQVPRRLVYVVNRRTVVDQTTNEVERYREKLDAAGLTDALRNLTSTTSGSPLAVSTLRGHFADNSKWSVDPTRPAVICGTVDMIGSRLLFSGYGLGFKTKPLHAGFLGQDTLVVHDEAHLEPAFQTLIETIKSEQQRCNEFGTFKILELTATSRAGANAFELTTEEQQPQVDISLKTTQPIHVVWQRMKAKKGVTLNTCKRNVIAKTIGELARNRWAKSELAILVFVRTVDDVKEVIAELTNRKKGVVPLDQVQSLTGTMRGYERDRLATEDPVFARFIPDSKCESKSGTVYLVCTSAGEVGVDISADHLICDLTPLDSLAQRFGRVNRRGTGVAEVDVIYEDDPNPKPLSENFELARWETLRFLQGMKQCDWCSDRIDASPLSLGVQIRTLSDSQRQAAFTPTPQVLEIPDRLFDAWALTSIRGRMPGRPHVAPYLHGVADWESPETQFAWRDEVSRISGDLLQHYPPEDLLADYPIKPHEKLSEPSHRAFKQLELLAKRFPDEPSWLVDQDGVVTVKTMCELADKTQKQQIEGKLILLPPNVGGLRSGMLDGNSDEPVSDIADEYFVDQDKSARHRSRIVGEFETIAPTGMHLVRRIELPSSLVDDSESLQFWYWFKRQNEGDKSATHAVGWRTHVDDVVVHAKQFLSKLSLGIEIERAILAAAEYHDHGKRRKQFQLMLGNAAYPDKLFAKSGRKGGLLPEVYRHEFGSLVDSVNLEGISNDERELTLHLIAAHHGRARPCFSRAECFDPENSQDVADRIAIEVSQRFARLQRKYGRWGLAYLESILRAADWAASASPSPEPDHHPIAVT